MKIEKVKPGRCHGIGVMMETWLKIAACLPGIALSLVWIGIGVPVGLMWKLSHYWWQYPVDVAFTAAWLCLPPLMLRWVWKGEP